MSRMLPARGDEATTWEGHPERDAYRLANGGMGMCNTGSGVRCVCVLGGIGCNVDHVSIARDNLKRVVA